MKDAKEALVIWENAEIRTIEIDGQKWIPAIDVAKALGYDNPSRAASDILNRNQERFVDYAKIVGIKTNKDSLDKRKKHTSILNLKGVIAFCMLSDMPKAIPFQRWADNVLEKHIKEIPSNIELIIKRKRVLFTDDLKEHGINKRYEYANITNSMKEKLGIRKEVKKADCDLIEKLKIALAEDTARINIMQENPEGYHEVKPVCDKSAEMAKIATTQKEAQYIK